MQVFPSATLQPADNDVWCLPPVDKFSPTSQLFRSNKLFAQLKPDLLPFLQSIIFPSPTDWAQYFIASIRNWWPILRDRASFTAFLRPQRIIQEPRLSDLCILYAHGSQFLGYFNFCLDILLTVSAKIFDLIFGSLFLEHHNENKLYFLVDVRSNFQLFDFQITIVTPCHNV